MAALPERPGAPLTGADVDHAVRAGIAKAQQDERNAPPDAAVAYRKILPSLVTVTATQPAGPVPIRETRYADRGGGCADRVGSSG